MEAGNVATPRARPGAPRTPDFGIADPNTSSSASRSVAAGAQPRLDMSLMGGTGQPPGSEGSLGGSPNNAFFMSDDSTAPGSRGSVGSAGHDDFERQATDYARGLLEQTQTDEPFPFRGSGFGRNDPATAADGFDTARGPDVSFSPGGGFRTAPPPARAPQPMPDRQLIPAGPSGSNMTPSTRAYPDPFALAERERQLRIEAMRQKLDYAGGLRAY